MWPSNSRIAWGTRLLSNWLSRRNDRVEIRRIENELLLVDAVAAQSVEREALADAVVESPAPARITVLGVLPLGAKAPGNADPRGEIAMVADAGLCFVAQAETEGEIGTRPPIVEGEEADVKLVEAGERIAGRERELAGAATGRADLLRGPARLLAHRA